MREEMESMGKDLKQLLSVHVIWSNVKGKNEHEKNERYKIKKKQMDSLWLKNTVPVMKNSLDEINSKLHTVEEKVSNRKHPNATQRKKTGKR